MKNAQKFRSVHKSNMKYIVLQSLAMYLRSIDVENENGELLETDDLLGAIGENLRETVYDDIKSIRHVYHDPRKLCNVDSRNFINNRSTGVVSFFLGLLKLIQLMSPRKFYFHLLMQLNVYVIYVIFK